MLLEKNFKNHQIGEQVPLAGSVATKSFIFVTELAALCVTCHRVVSWPRLE
jgi:predicted HNH restriction endonuclease